MRVTRVGVTPLKGARHEALGGVHLTGTGAVGDRTFCLVDRGRRRILRTVEDPVLMSVRARLDGRVLRLRLGLEEVSGEPGQSGELLDCDYWGRRVELRVQHSAHAELLSGHVGREVVLARVPRPGAVVYGAPVTVVTATALEELADRVGAPSIDPARFRATVAVDDRDDPLEHAPPGTRLRLGAAAVELGGFVPRCAVVDLDPSTGRKDGRLLEALAGYRRSAGEVFFGRYARVVSPGRVSPGDVVER